MTSIKISEFISYHPGLSANASVTQDGVTVGRVTRSPDRYVVTIANGRRIFTGEDDAHDHIMERIREWIGEKLSE